MIRRNFFLKKKWVLLTAAVMIYVYFSWSGFPMWAVLGVCGGWLWLNRRRDLPWRDTLRSDGEMFLSPVDGEVVKIGTWTDPEAGFAYSEVRLRMNYTNNWGLHLPSSCEMEFLKNYPGRRSNRKDLAHITTDESGPLEKTDMVLRSKNGVASRLRFLQCEIGRSPKIWMKSGDRGRGAACFGYYPFGGSLIVYVPQPSDILVVENEKITAGQTVLAVFKTQE